MKARYFWPMKVKEPGSSEYVEMPAGYVIDHPDAWQQVMSGNAEPADDECQKRCEAAGLTKDLAADLKRRGERQMRRIHPEDWDIYEAGLMNGYDAEMRPTLDGQLVKPSIIAEFRRRQSETDDAEDKGIIPKGFEDLADAPKEPAPLDE